MSDPQLPSRSHPHHAVYGALGRPTLVFLTVCTKDRKPILANKSAHDILVNQWSKASAWRVGKYVVMPDHVHLFVTPGQPQLPLQKWVMFWKRMTARKLTAGIWQEEYWDYTLRTGDSYAQKWDYVRDNPVRKGLVARPEDWPYCGELNHFMW